MIYTSVAFLSCTLHVRLPLLLNVHLSCGLLLVMHAMAPALVFCFLTFKQFCRLVLVDKMVNPLPIRNLSWQTFKQKVQELFQLLLNNPLRTLVALVTLVIARGLWIPFIKYTFLYRSFGFIVLLRALCYPIEFLVKKLPLRYRRILWPYLQETLEIFLRPLQISIDCSSLRSSCYFLVRCTRSAHLDLKRGGSGGATFSKRCSALQAESCLELQFLSLHLES